MEEREGKKSKKEREREDNPANRGGKKKEEESLNLWLGVWDLRELNQEDRISTHSQLTQANSASSSSFAQKIRG